MKNCFLILAGLLLSFAAAAQGSPDAEKIKADIEENRFDFLPFLALCSCFGLEGYGYPRLTEEEALRSWNGTLHCPFAANLQIIFYKNRCGEVLVKFLTNERETPIPELEAYSGPYYRWEDVKAYATRLW